MARPRKKKKPVSKKAAPEQAATRKPPAKKAAGKRAARRAGSAAIGQATKAEKNAPGSRILASRREAATRRESASPREKLIAVRPSGGKDDSFFDLVHEVARQIPRGRVTSYGAIGAALGTRSSARMVGWAMNACHLSPKPVPAHRVVNSVGLLTGRHHFKPPEKMQLLLEEEGVLVENNKVVHFQKLFWDPSKEL
jgi:methylated-DNA-protein-cysteine methyltransferase-like protein